MKKILLLLLMYLYGTVVYGFEVGKTAYDEGDYDIALDRWTKLAKQGDQKSQFGLGVMYGSGYGVKQNFTKAYMWFVIAEKNGNTKSKQAIDVISPEMTSEQISISKILVAKCLNSNYTQCGL